MQKQLKNKLDEVVAAKNDEKLELEKKVNDLLDTLYGCNYCGQQACALECDEYRKFLEADNADDEENDEAGQDIPEQSEPLKHHRIHPNLVVAHLHGQDTTSYTPMQKLRGR